MNRAQRRRARRQLAAYGAEPRRWTEPDDLAALCREDARLAALAHSARELDTLLRLGAPDPHRPRTALVRLTLPLAAVVLMAVGFASAWHEPAPRPALEALALL